MGYWTGWYIWVLFMCLSQCCHYHFSQACTIKINLDRSMRVFGSLKKKVNWLVVVSYCDKSFVGGVYDLYKEHTKILS